MTAPSNCSYGKSCYQVCEKIRERQLRVIRRLFLEVTSDENVWIDFIKLSKNIFTVQASSRCHVAEVAKKIFSVTIVGRCSSNYEMKEPLYRDLFIEKIGGFLKI